MADKAEKKKQGPANYQVFSKDEEGNLSPLVRATGRTPAQVVSKVVADNKEFVGLTLVVVPERSLKPFATEVETKTRVRVSAG